VWSPIVEATKAKHMIFSEPSFSLATFNEDSLSFREKFLHWLTEHSKWIPLEKYCEEGWPSEQIQLIIERCHFHPNSIEVEFTALFDECISSCCHLGTEIEENGFYSIPRRGSFLCFIDRKNDTFTIQSLEQ